MDKERLEEAYLGVMLGTAAGDALGLAWEGMKARHVRKEVRRIVPPFFLVSDDTEQTVFVAEALCAHPQDLTKQVRRLRRCMVGWLMRLPFGIGWGTLRACCRSLLGLRVTGVRSAGNGAAMRAALLGVRFRNDPVALRQHSRAIAEVTHLDERAVEGALFVSIVARCCLKGLTPRECVAAAMEEVHHQALRDAIALGMGCAESGNPASLERTGFIVHSVAVLSYVFCRFGDCPKEAVFEAIALGGDTDTHAAMLGAWLGVMHGPDWCLEWTEMLMPGLGDEVHLRSLAWLLSQSESQSVEVPRWSRSWALLRNLLMFPIILAYAMLRIPFAQASGFQS